MRSALKPERREKEKERKIISDKLLIEKTGEPLEHWFRVLDKKGARQFSHAQIFKVVASTSPLDKLGEWNQNLLSTSYEWSRGLRKRGEKKPGDFEASVSKVIHAPLKALYEAWIQEPSRNKWLGEKGVLIRKYTDLKSCRVTWPDGSSLSVDFYHKGEHKSQVTVQHQKITTSAEREARKKYWLEKLIVLKDLLEKKHS